MLWISRTSGHVTKTIFSKIRRNSVSYSVSLKLDFLVFPLNTCRAKLPKFGSKSQEKSKKNKIQAEN